VTLYVNGLAYGSPTTSTNFSFSWSTNNAGFYTFVAVARDNDGFTNGSPPVTVILDPPGGNLPVAVISNLVSPLVTTNYSTFTITNPPILRDGLYDLLGQARDSDSTPSYQVVLRRPGETLDFANVTPVPIGGALNYQGFRDGGDNNSDLGILNLSTIPNGVYDLFLRVRGGGDQVSTQLRVTIDNALKIGQFSFSEQDLVIPVNGIPLTVVRTYNSLNPVQGDFGYNWTYAINDMDAVIDEDRQITSAFTSTGDDPYDGTPNLFSVRTGGGRDVTLTLPEGRRTTFLFTPAFRVVGGVATAYAEWQSAPGVTASLTMMGNNVINSFGGLGLQFPYFASGESRTPFEAFDIEGYNLAMKDGTIYELHRDPALPGPQTCHGITATVSATTGRSRPIRVSLS